MKVYFCFRLKDEFIKLYKDTPSVLYNILKSIYYLDKDEITYGYTLLNQLIKPIDKNLLDRKIFIKYHNDMPYSKRGEIHYINNSYRNEISRLEIHKSYIKVELEQKESSFFNILKEEYSNLFICSFNRLDFFFL